jgi:hypothetical protein
MLLASGSPEAMDVSAGAEPRLVGNRLMSRAGRGRTARMQVRDRTVAAVTFAGLDLETAASGGPGLRATRLRLATSDGFLLSHVTHGLPRALDVKASDVPGPRSASPQTPRQCRKDWR